MQKWVKKKEKEKKEKTRQKNKEKSLGNNIALVSTTDMDLKHVSSLSYNDDIEKIKKIVRNTEKQ